MLNFFGSDDFHRGDAIFRRSVIPEIEELARKVGHARAGGFEGKKRAALEIGFTSAKVVGGDRGFLQFSQFGDNRGDEAVGGFEARSGVNGEHAGVAIVIGFAENGVGEALFFADVLEKARRHAAAEKIAHDGKRITTRIGHGAGRHADTDVNLLEFAFGATGKIGSGDGRGLGVTVGDGLTVAKARSGEIDEPLMRDIASGGDDDIVGRVVAAKGGAKRCVIEVADSFRSAENGPAERMLPPKISREHFMDKVFRIVLNHADFFEDDGALALDFIGGKLGVEDHIGENIEHGVEMFIEHASVEAGHFLGGEGVDHAADGIDFASDGFGRAAAGAFEEHVFKKMEDTVEVRSFIARAGTNPDAHGNGTDVWHGFRDDDKAIGQSGLLHGPILRAHSRSFGQRTTQQLMRVGIENLSVR